MECCGGQTACNAHGAWLPHTHPCCVLRDDVLGQVEGLLQGARQLKVKTDVGIGVVRRDGKRWHQQVERHAAGIAARLGCAAWLGGWRSGQRGFDACAGVASAGRAAVLRSEQQHRVATVVDAMIPEAGRSMHSGWAGWACVAGSTRQLPHVCEIENWMKKQHTGLCVHFSSMVPCQSSHSLKVALTEGIDEE